MCHGRHTAAPGATFERRVTFFTASACRMSAPALLVLTKAGGETAGSDTLVLGEDKMLPTKRRFRTSTPLMRTTVAWMMALMLVSIATICPAIACPIKVNSSTSKSCCHEPKPQQPTSCPRPTIQNCPYLILEKSTPPTTTFDALPVSLLPVSFKLPALNRLRSFGTEDRLPDSSGLFLRIRVLLI